MPKTFDRAPELPKVRRRIGRDTTELLITTLALLGTVGLVGIMIRASVFDISSQAEYDFIKYFFIASTAVLWLVVVRLELTAKKKAEEVYDTQMKEYEIIRTKWLEIATMKLEREAQSTMDSNVMVPPKVTKSQMVEIKSEASVDTGSDEENQQGGQGTTEYAPQPRRLVKLSILEYEDRTVPLPLFFSSLGLMTGFTFVFPLLGILTLPTAIFVVVSIINGDIDFIDEEVKPVIQEEE